MPSKRYHILLIGGTGVCGQIFTQAAIQEGRFVTLYVRTPSKLPSEISSHSNVAVIQGDLGDEEGLKKAAACEADTFISLAGPTMGERKGTVRFLRSPMALRWY
jgi:Trk K+ transport system NAD-binding subunit